MCLGVGNAIFGSEHELSKGYGSHLHSFMIPQDVVVTKSPKHCRLPIYTGPPLNEVSVYTALHRILSSLI